MKRFGRYTAYLGVALTIFLVLVAAGKTIKVVRETPAREGPGSYYKLVKVIPEGTTLEVLETKKNWHKVKYDKVEVWISENSIAKEKAKATTDVFGSLAAGPVSTGASPATLTAAIKGFWIRYNKSSEQPVELPVNGYEIPSGVYESFESGHSRAVKKDQLFKKYKLRSDYRKGLPSYEKEMSIGYTCVSSVADAPLIEDESLIRYLYSVGWYVGESTERYDMRYIFYVLDTDRVNAVSAPGGYIILTRGLLELMRDESELAALLAHEMAHIVAGHGAREVVDDKLRIKTDKAFQALERETGKSSEIEADLLAVAERAITFVKRPKLDKYEYEADEMAIRYLARCGYDLGGLTRLLTNLNDKHARNIDMFDINYKNHPDFRERLKRVNDEIKDYKRYNGMRFEDDFKRNMKL